MSNKCSQMAMAKAKLSDFFHSILGKLNVFRSFSIDSD